MFEQLSFEHLLVFSDSSDNNANSSPPTSQSDGETLQRLSLLSSGSDAASPPLNVSLLSSGSDAQTESRQELAWVNQYSPGRRTTRYYRLSYNWHGKKKHTHIRGGNINSSVATRRAEQLSHAIDRGATIEQLLKAIAFFN